MKLVGDFLSRFQNLTPPNDAIKRAIQESLRETVGVEIPRENISIQHGVVFLKASSIVKNTIRINRGKILETIFLSLPKARESIRDIR